MALEIKGKDVNNYIKEKIDTILSELKNKNIVPTLATVRVGENPSDISYEKGAIKKFESLGLAVKSFVLPENIKTPVLTTMLQSLNTIDEINGILLFRPLPKHIDEEESVNAISPLKDVDCMSEASLGKIYFNKDADFLPCTPAACLMALDYLGEDVSGKNCVIIGRSQVVGKPLSNMLLNKDATVTICHSKSENMKEITKEADYIFSSIGKAKLLGKEYFSPKNIVIDVGINFDEEGKLCGDIDYNEVKDIVKAITPVPGGIGGITTTVLAYNTALACKKQNI